MPRHAVRGMNVGGGDVVCLMPIEDRPSMITAVVAAAVMFEIIALIAEPCRRVGIHRTLGSVLTNPARQR